VSGSGVTDDAVALLLDARGHVLNWPDQAERLLGHPPGEVLGRPVVDLLADPGPEPGRFLAEGGWAGLLTARHRDGREVPVEVRIVALPRGAGDARWAVLAEGAARSALWGLSPALLRRLAARTPAGLVVVDTGLRCVWSNDAMERFGGGTARERLGRRLRDIQPGLGADVLEIQMRRVLDTGIPVFDYEHVGRPGSDPHHDHAHSISFVRLEDDAGHPFGVCYSVVDITDRYRALKRLALLDRASEHIGRSLDPVRTAQDLAEAAVPDLADHVVVDLLDSVLRGAEPKSADPSVAGTAARMGAGDGAAPAPPVRLPPLRRAGSRSVPGSSPPTAFRIGEPATYRSSTPPVVCLTEGTSWWAARLDPDALEWGSGVTGGRAATFGERGAHTAMVVPIRVQGVTLGVTSFFRTGRDEPFDAEDLRLAEEFVARAAVWIDNARRYTRERDAALVLQRSLLPHGIPPQVAVEVASCYRPADELTGVGGDWFDVIPLSGARVALVVGEVTGHGIEAAATMGQLRTAVRTLADLDLRPEELLAHLDDLVSQVAREERAEQQAGAEQELGTGSLGSSCLYVVYDPVGRSCVMASAGHPPPAVIGPAGDAADFPDLPVGPALGVGGLPFESVEFGLAEGSLLALFTDGLIGTPETALDSLGPLLRGPERSLERLVSQVMDKLAPARPFDDAALLLARTRGLDAGQVASWVLPADPAVVGRSREMAAAQLGAWGLDEDLAFTTELVVSELVTNAIRHASGPIGLRLILERTLICEVSDASSTSPHLRHARTTDEGGRGLFLISQFAQRWGTRYTADGKIIWAEQQLAPGADGRAADRLEAAWALPDVG
jgi:PAS domain-containing protein/anti-sigma regulatory factor (Ser/Thr protein kinase)